MPGGGPQSGLLGFRELHRALAIDGGHATLVRTLLRDFAAGAIVVNAAQLDLIDCTVQDCQAQMGGALLVRGGAMVSVEGGSFLRNRAVLSGGALQMDDGHVNLANRTLFEQNVAPDGNGSTAYLSHSSSLEYTLPAPPGRWLNVRQGMTFRLDRAVEDLDLPYICAAGVVGGVVPEEQLGPGCSRLCPAAVSYTHLTLPTICSV
eukprot:6577735-Prymnesium_polylepis.2